MERPGEEIVCVFGRLITTLFDSGTTESNCWAWDRNFDAPTCTPSIEILGKLQDDGSFPWHWHGYLTNGIFRSC